MGLTISQRYSKSITRKIEINFRLGKKKKTILREWLDRVDRQRQNQSIIPNVIHSMDASHLIMLINTWRKKGKYILPIHDCFGTYPNDMHELFVLVKSTFIVLYFNQDFLKEYHKNFLNDLKRYKIEIRRMKNES